MAEMMLKRQGIAIRDLAPAEAAKAKQAMLRAGIDFSEALKARYEGDFNYEPRDKLLKATLADPAREALADTRGCPDNCNRPRRPTGTTALQEGRARSRVRSPLRGPWKSLSRPAGSDKALGQSDRGSGWRHLSTLRGRMRRQAPRRLHAQGCRTLP